MTGSELRHIRESAGLTVAALARRSGVTRETIHRIEAGTATRIRSDTLAKLQHGLRDEPTLPMIGEDPRTRLLRLFDQTPAPVQAWLLATAEMAAQGFGLAHEATPAGVLLTRKKAPAAGAEDLTGPERPRQVSFLA